MAAGFRDKNIVKIFILYLLWNIDTPLDFDTVNDIALQDGYVGYFDFAECFAELLDDGHVAKLSAEDGTDVYRITEKGINVAENLSEDLFAEIRDRSLKSALRLLSFRKRRAELKYTCEDVPDADGGGYSVTCEVREHGARSFQVTLWVDSKTRADEIKKNFYERPEAIYKGTFAVLTGDADFFFSK